MSKKEVERDYLTKEELQTIAEKPLLDRLALVRDIFLFSCFTGLAYADVGKVRRSEVGIGVDGGQWIYASAKNENSITDTHSSHSLCDYRLYKDHP